MKKSSIKKFASILGISIIALAVVLCIVNEATFYNNVSTYLKANSASGSPIDYSGIISGFASPLQSLITGLGLGGVLILLGYFIDTKDDDASSAVVEEIDNVATDDTILEETTSL